MLNKKGRVLKPRLIYIFNTIKLELRLKTRQATFSGVIPDQPVKGFGYLIFTGTGNL